MTKYFSCGLALESLKLDFEYPLAPPQMDSCNIPGPEIKIKPWMDSLMQEKCQLNKPSKNSLSD